MRIGQKRGGSCAINKIQIKCCACGSTVLLRKTDTIQLVALIYKAEWNAPTWKMPQDNTKRAVAIVCDKCHREGRTPKEAIEIDVNHGGKVSFHALEELKRTETIA